MRAQEIVRVAGFQILQCEFGASESERCAQRIDRDSPEFHLLAMQRETAVGLRGERIEFPIGQERAGEIAGRRAKQFREFVQIGNGGIQLSTKRQVGPTAAFLWPEQLAIDG